MKTFISVEEALSIILDTVDVQPSEQVALADLLGRTLAQPIHSREDIPPFDNSAMDGFAVRSEDLQTLPALLSVIEDIPAGSFPEKTVEVGTCSRIMTGAPFPEGADAVAPVEWTEPGANGTVQFNRTPVSGENVRLAGKDVREGEQMFEPGQDITPPVIGMLAKLGYADAVVSVQPRVAVISTGDELVDPGETLGPGQIRDSNGPALVAQVTAAGAYPLLRLRASDSPESVRSVVTQALAADVIIFSGGVSVGDYDFIKQVLDEMGMELLFWKVRQKPGKPLAFGTLQGRIVFGLPGNPVSSAMCFEQFVRPALSKMLGRTTLHRPRYPALLDAPTPKKPGLHYFARGHAFYDEEGRLRVHDTGSQASNIYSSVVKANCVFHLPEAMDAPPVGTRVEIEWLDW